MNSASFSVGRHELDHRRASIPRTTARNSAPDPGYPKGARAEKRSASRKPSVVTSVDRDESGRRLRGLQIARRLLAPLGESKAFLGIEELHGTCGHHGLLALHCVLSDHASIAWPVIQFWGSWLGTVKRKRREADRKLVAVARVRDLPVLAIDLPTQAACWAFCLAGRGSMIAMPRSMRGSVEQSPGKAKWHASRQRALSSRFSTWFTKTARCVPIAECRATTSGASMAMPPRVPSSKNRTGSSRRSQGLRPLA